MSTFIRELSHYEICICGLDVLGSNIAVGLARIGAQRLTLIDDEKVTPESLFYPPFGWADLDCFRTKAISHELIRCKDILPDAVGFRVKDSNIASFIGDAELVVNTFNDEQAIIVAQHCQHFSIPCLRVIVSKTQAGSEQTRVDLMWEDEGRIHSSNDDVGTECLIASALAVDLIADFALYGQKENIEYIPAVA